MVLAARGYPGSYQKGSVIRGLAHVSTAKVLQLPLYTAGSGRHALDEGTVLQLKLVGRQVFHAGTSTNEAGEVTSVGGRVLAVTAMGADVAEAQAKAYQASMAVLLSLPSA